SVHGAYLLSFPTRRSSDLFPPSGIDRTDSFFARTVPATKDPARMYMGIAAQGRGPKLVFLRSLTTLLAAAQAEFDANAVAGGGRSEEHTSELQSRENLVCR